ncbi:MAG: transcriptional regulator [Thermoplasmata archaeon]|nr:transcriptional regulator [Thermoplasmata archaeon]
MIEIEKGSMAERIVKTVQKDYPVTIKEIASKLGVSVNKVTMEIIKLQKRGIVDIDILPDKKFVRMIRFDIVFVGRQRQYKLIKKKKRNVDEDREDDKDDIMYS